MAKPQRFTSPDYSDKTYFVTTDTWGRRPLFSTERMARAFLDRLFSYRGQGKFATPRICSDARPRSSPDYAAGNHA